VDRAQTLAEIDRRIRRHLPPSIADHVSVANLRDGVLVLQTPAAEWRTRVHFLVPQILEDLRSDPSLPKVVQIRIRISPIPRPETSPANGPKLSAVSSQLLLETAHAFGDDALGKALARLARRRRK
jgi:hypothetical protein